MSTPVLGPPHPSPPATSAEPAAPRPDHRPATDIALETRAFHHRVSLAAHFLRQAHRGLAPRLILLHGPRGLALRASASLADDHAALATLTLDVPSPLAAAGEGFCRAVSAPGLLSALDTFVADQRAHPGEEALLRLRVDRVTQRLSLSQRTLSVRLDTLPPPSDGVPPPPVTPCTLDAGHLRRAVHAMLKHVPNLHGAAPGVEHLVARVRTPAGVGPVVDLFAADGVCMLHQRLPILDGPPAEGTFLLPPSLVGIWQEVSVDGISTASVALGPDTACLSVEGTQLTLRLGSAQGTPPHDLILAMAQDGIALETRTVDLELALRLAQPYQYRGAVLLEGDAQGLRVYSRAPLQPAEASPSSIAEVGEADNRVPAVISAPFARWVNPQRLLALLAFLGADTATLLMRGGARASRGEKEPIRLTSVDRPGRVAVLMPMWDGPRPPDWRSA